MKTIRFHTAKKGNSGIVVSLRNEDIMAGMYQQPPLIWIWTLAIGIFQMHGASLCRCISSQTIAPQNHYCYFHLNLTLGWNWVIIIISKLYSQGFMFVSNVCRRRIHIGTFKFPGIEFHNFNPSSSPKWNKKRHYAKKHARQNVNVCAVHTYIHSTV